MVLTAPSIALVGNPNTGKSALFNALTGSRQKTGNYPGVTVERREGDLVSPNGHRVRVIDLPGTYSLRARSPDEAVTRDAVLGRLDHDPRPDAVVCVADATNLRLNLRLALELRRIGLPVILAVNMIDLAERRGDRIDLPALSAALGVPVVPTVAVRRGGTTALLAEIDRTLDGLTARCDALRPAPTRWHEPSSADLRAYHREVETILKSSLVPGRPARVSERIDSVVLHPLLGPMVLLVLLFALFQAVFTWASVPMDAIDSGFVALQELARSLLPPGQLASLIVDGLIGGVGSVVIFLPQILILFLFILVLEDSGYMARAAFLLDRLMGGVGLHGRAFIPLLSSFACAIPGIMAARVIENKYDRLATILIAPLMTCSARLPVYALVIAAFVPNTTVGGVFGLQGLVLFTLYIAGLASALAVAFVLRRTILRGARQPLLLELPSYRIPRLSNLAIGLATKAKMFLVRAGTVILSMIVLVWFLASFPAVPDGADGPAIRHTYAGQIGRALEPVLAPIGFSWEIAIALIPAMAAREAAVAGLGTVYALSDEGGTLTQSLAATLAQSWTLPTALALLAWFVFAPQCVSTLVVARRETGGWLWPGVMFGYLLVLAYGAAFVTYWAATMVNAS